MDLVRVLHGRNQYWWESSMPARIYFANKTSKLRSQVSSKPHFHDASFSLSKVPVDILSLRCTLFTRDKNNTGFSKSLAATSDWLGAPL
jgi:hypothetical protein